MESPRIRNYHERIAKKKELDSKIRSLCQRGQNGHCEETFLFSESRQLMAIEYKKGCSTIRIHENSGFFFSFETDVFIVVVVVVVVVV